MQVPSTLEGERNNRRQSQLLVSLANTTHHVLRTDGVLVRALAENPGNLAAARIIKWQFTLWLVDASANELHGERDNGKKKSCFWGTP